MATITFNIPDAELTRSINALAIHFKYDVDVHGANKTAFVKQSVAKLIKHLIRIQEQNDALATSIASIVDVDITSV